jgi:hypothetical protein
MTLTDDKSPHIAFARLNDEQKRRLRWSAQQRFVTESVVLRDLIMGLPKKGEIEKGAA